MLFSELNRINLNVLIQDASYEKVPDLNAYYVHNAKNWTIWCKEKFNKTNLLPYAEEDENVIDNGWEISALQSDNLENSYLERALTDISESLTTTEESDIVKIYAGQFTAEGTLDYDALTNNDDIFPCFAGTRPFAKRDMPFPPLSPQFGPIMGSWWTFNNGAFQWTNGPKSIQECRFSYGPFTGPDPHHWCDTNHKMMDNYLRLSKLPNLNFIFDKLHVLKGIVSLPCANEQLKANTKNFIYNFLQNFVWQKYKNGMSFKTLDGILREFSKEYAYIPTIRVSHGFDKPEFEKPVDAVFDVAYAVPPADEDGEFKYVFPDENDFNAFVHKSFWKNFDANYSFKNEYVDPFKPAEALHASMQDVPADEEEISVVVDHVNTLQHTVHKLYNDVDSYKLYTILSEKQFVPCSFEDDFTALMTLSDLFRQTKAIEKLELTFDENESKQLHVIVLPEGFCNKEMLKLISNVKYIGD